MSFKIEAQQANAVNISNLLTGKHLKPSAQNDSNKSLNVLSKR